MKVLQVINSLNTGGAEKLLLDSIPIFNKKGIEMDLFLLNGNEYPFLQELKKQEVCEVYTNGNKSVYNPRHIFSIMKFMSKYDVIHVHLFPSQYWVILAKIFSRSKTKLVFTEHCTTNRRMENYFFKKINKISYRFYDFNISISKEILETYVNYTGLPYSRFRLIPNGVNLEGIKQAEPISKNEINPNIKEKDKLLIQVSGFREQKDQPTLIKSLTYLEDNVKLLLVGEGVTKDTCIELVKNLGLEDRVFFLGVRTDVPRLLKSSNIVVLSTHYEGMSLACIEGMSSGRPFIASDVPGMSEIAEGAAILFEEENTEELSVEIKKLLTDERYYAEIVDKCQKRADNYDINTLVDANIEVYKEALKK